MIVLLIIGIWIVLAAIYYFLYFKFDWILYIPAWADNTLAFTIGLPGTILFLLMTNWQDSEPPYPDMNYQNHDFSYRGAGPVHGTVSNKEHLDSFKDIDTIK